MEQKHREPGYYWVKLSTGPADWHILYWWPNQGWSDLYMDIIKHKQDEGVIIAVNEARIPSPDDVVVIADETCEMTPEMWRKLAERVKNKAQ